MMLSQKTMLVVRSLAWISLTLVGVVLATALANYLHSRGRLREIAAQNVSAIRLWHIGKALRDYCSHHGRLPPLTSCDANGRPLLSWRVHLLPFLGQEELYKQFHLDEPWDSKHNAALISKMPNAYNFDPGNRNCDVSDCEGRTCFVAITGVGTPFSTVNARGAMSADQMMQSKDIIVVEADESCPTIWSKPKDVGICAGPSKPISGVSGRRQGKVLCLLASGCVVSVPPESIGDKDSGKRATIVVEKVNEAR
jgi:hypothetical protein